MVTGSLWRLTVGVNGYGSCVGNELVTQAAAGRSFELINYPLNQDISEKNLTRARVRLLEDGYECWLDLSEIINNACSRGAWKPELFALSQIEERLLDVVSWVEDAATKLNKYLWGGTLGPDFDCSGLIQAAFASKGIWLPRDAYQQEEFCEKLNVDLENPRILRPGDLIFFGSAYRCTHVALYRGKGLYWHSSGLDKGRNGIGCDGLCSNDRNPLAAYYRSIFRGAGRVVRCHDGTTLP